MRRREFITLLGGAAAAWPRAGIAQPTDRPVRLGLLMGYADNDPEGVVRAKALVQQLQTLGWTDGRNLRIDYRWAVGSAQQMAQMAKELVALQPDVIVSHTTAPTAAVVRETRTIPIVFVTVSDPVGGGFVASLARPGGNVTGFANFEASLAGKWVEVLKELSPGLARVAILFNPDTAPGNGSYYNDPIENAAPRFGVKTVPAAVQNEADIERAFSTIARDGDAGAITTPDIFLVIQRHVIIAMAARYRVPTIYPFRFFAAPGGLVAYGIDTVDLFQRAASYVDRILRGIRPGDLPVQGPTNFQLIINLKTAKALGLTIPRRLLLTAHEVIE